MEFLNPLALYGFFALPLLLIPYLIRRKPRRTLFSSLILFSQQPSGATAKPWRRLRLPPIFFLQLLLLILLILALGEPVFSVRVSNVAIVLDNSASMQALEQGTTRFALARDKAQSLLGELDATAAVDLYLTVPQLARATSSRLTPASAATLLETLEPFDLPDLSVDYDAVLRQLAQERKYQRIYFVTDRPTHGQSGVLRVVSVGHPQGNMALTSFRIGRSSLSNSRLEAAITVTNFYPQERRVKVLLRGSGTILASREIALSAGRSSTVSFSGFPQHPYYEAEIDIRDPLPLDNRRFAVPTDTRNLKILGISPRPQALTSLRLITGVSLEVVSPADYGKTDRSSYDLEIFHLSSPTTLPNVPSLLVLPPETNPFITPGKPVSRVVVSNWRESHPLTRYLNFALLRPPYAHPFTPKFPGATVIESSEGSLAFAAERRGVRYLVLGFDPFPYLGRENLPMSIFTLNFLDWFLERSKAEGTATGEPIALGALEQETHMLTPKGEKATLQPATSRFAATYFQGIYQLTQRARQDFFAVNLQDANESNLSEPLGLELKGDGDKNGSVSMLFSLWPYLLLLSLLLFIIEWFFVPRVLRLRVPTRRTTSELT